MTEAIRSEWIKLRSARSNVVLVILAVVVPVAFTVLLCYAPTKSNLEQSDHFPLILVGTTIGLFLFGVLGVLVIGQEYRHSTIRVTFTAEPKRTRVMAAKVIALLLMGLVVGTIAAGLSYVIGNAILTSRGFDLLLPGSTQARAVIGTALLFALYALCGLGLGAIIRATAGAITLFILWPLIVETTLGALFSSTRKYMPFNAASALTDTDATRSTDMFTPWVGGAWFAGFVLLLLVLGTALVMRRDA
jgi:ABC-2 type transport system permease protein